MMSKNYWTVWISHQHFTQSSVMFIFKIWLFFNPFPFPLCCVDIMSVLSPMEAASKYCTFQIKFGIFMLFCLVLCRGTGCCTRRCFLDTGRWPDGWSSATRRRRKSGTGWVRGCLSRNKQTIHRWDGNVISGWFTMPKTYHVWERRISGAWLESI